MKFLVVGKVTSNQVDRLREEAEKRGHSLDNCSSRDLISISQNGEYKPSIPGLDLESFDLIYLLTLGQRRWEWYVAGNFLNSKGVAIIEKKLVTAEDKYFATATSELYKLAQQQILFPKTAVVLGIRTVSQVLSGFNLPVVVKVGELQRGLGVYKATSEAQVKQIIREHPESASFMIREFIPNDGDIRVFTVGGKAIGAMKRIPATGDFRSNISRGGTGQPFDLTTHPEITQLAETVANLNQTEIAGVDIILHQQTGQPYVLEINRSPQFRGLEQYAKINAAAKIIEYFESRVG